MYISPAVQDAVDEKAKKLMPHIRKVLDEVVKEMPHMTQAEKKKLLASLAIAIDKYGKNYVNSNYFGGLTIYTV